MSYLLDKKLKEKKFLKIAFGVIILIFLFFFRSSIFYGFSYLGQGLFRPVLIAGNSIGGKLKSLGAYFVSKNSLYLQNQKLQADLNFDEARMSNYDSVVAENLSLKEILGRKDTKANMVLGAVLTKSNQNVYDTLIIDAGSNQRIKIGNIVFALGNIPIGQISEAYANSSKVILFSNAGEKTQVIISGKDISMELVGRGGGNFEMILPRDLTLQKGDQVVLPGVNNYLLAIAETIISDPRDPFTKALLKSPVNIQNLKFVEVGQ